MKAGSNALSPQGIFKGDTLVVDRAKTVAPGAIVVAVMSDSFVVRLWQQAPFPALVSTLDIVPAITIGEEGVEIWGVVTHSVRQHGKCGDADG
jgi:DNA polymerase V